MFKYKKTIMPEPVSSSQSERNIREQQNSRTNPITCKVSPFRNCASARDTAPYPSPNAMAIPREYETSRPGGIDMNASCTDSCTYKRAKTNY